MWLPVSMIVPFLDRPRAEQSLPPRRGGHADAVLRAVRRPVRRRLPDLEPDARRRRLVQRGPPVPRLGEPARTGCTTRRGSIPASRSWGCGASAPGSSSTSRASAASRRSCTRPPASTAPAPWKQLRHVTDPDDVAGPVLLPDPGRRRGAPVLPRAARPQERNGRARRLHDVLQPEPLPERSSRSRSMSYGATMAWLLFVITLVDHARAVPALAAVRLLRGRAMTAASADHGGGVRSRRAAPPAELTRTAMLTTLYAAILLVFLAPLAYAFADLDQDRGADVPGERADPAVGPADVRVGGRDRTTSTSCRCPTARRASSRSSGRAAATATSSTRRTPAPASSTGRARGGSLAQPWQTAPHFENYARGLERDRLPAAPREHADPRDRVDDRHGPLVHARRLWLRPVPVPGPRRAVHARPVDDLPARRGHPHPDVCRVREARLGGDLPAAPRPDVLRERLRRVPAPAVPAHDPARPRRGRDDRRRRPAPDPALGHPAAGLAGDRRGRDLHLRVLVERLLRAADLPRRPRGPAAAPGRRSPTSTASTSRTRR